MDKDLINLSTFREPIRPKNLFKIMMINHNNKNNVNNNNLTYSNDNNNNNYYYYYSKPILIQQRHLETIVISRQIDLLLNPLVSVSYLMHV